MRGWQLPNFLKMQPSKVLIKSSKAIISLYSNSTPNKIRKLKLASSKMKQKLKWMWHSFWSLANNMG